MPDQPSQQNQSATEESIKETLIAIIISFALAFVARSYVAEPFIIPTGSMAPTLLGAHMRFRSPDTGYSWASSPRDYADTAREYPIDPQGSALSGRDAVTYVDPMSHRRWSQPDVPLHSGDRILVQKYLYALRNPRRWDVAVFKHPEDPKTNLIKRVVGLPGEQLALVDGDVFTRSSDTEPWTIQRKPPRVQRAVWAPIFDSQYTPIHEPDEPPFVSPWSSPGWDTTTPVYRWDDSTPGTLSWNNKLFQLNDHVPYNDTGGFQSSNPFPVSDLRIRFSLKPDALPQSVSIRLSARAHDFEARIEHAVATLRMRPISQRRNPDAWIELASAPVSELSPTTYTSIELDHVDQSLALRINNSQVISASYNWDALERLANSLTSIDPSDPRVENPHEYLSPSVSITIAGTPASLTRVSIDRDLYYQSQRIGTHLSRASSLATAVRLDAKQYFMLGDNSPASRDARAFNHVDPWIAKLVGDRIGVVHRDLIMGRAFLVYFPSPHRNSIVPIPDFGRMHLIN